MEDSTKKRLENWLKARGVEDIPSSETDLLKKTIGFVQDPTKFLELENLDYHIPGGYVTSDAVEGEQGGNEQGGNNQGGNEQGGNNQGGSEQGGNEQGGDNQGGNNQGGSDQGGDNQGGNEQGGDNSGNNEGGSEIEVEEAAEWEYIHDEATWNESFANGALKLYYANNPDEDRWNVTENRAGNFNDKVYDVTLSGDNGIYEFAAHWETDDVQKITKVGDETEVYYLDMFYSLDENEHALFTDIALTESAGKTAVFKAIKWNDETCPHCWDGAINAPGAVLPWAWIAVKVTEDFVDGKVKLVYDGGEPVYLTKDGGFTSGYAIESVTSLFGADYDNTKLQASLVK